jgi:5-hydroxyisourate hydrolase
MSTISTHILEIARGGPANGVHVRLDFQNLDESWSQLAEAWTDDDGRVKPFFLVGAVLSAGNYRLVFDTEAYFSAYDIDCFYPQVCVSFKIGDSPQHYHVPLLLSPYGYSTYRGS